MMRVRKPLIAAGLGLVGLVALPTAAEAHGVGRRGDLPLPLWQFVWAAVLAIALSVAAAGWLWTSPRLARLATGRALPTPTLVLASVLALAGRVAGIAVFAATLGAALLVDESLSVNIAPWTIFVALWIGVQFASAMFGDVYRCINPLYTIATGIEVVHRRVSPAWVPVSHRPSHWPAVAGMAVFLWLELAYHNGTAPRILGWLMVLYSVGHLAAAWRYGREWLRTGEAFAAFFSLLAALSPVFAGPDGRLRLRVPGSGLASVEVFPGTAALILLTLGGASFDGLSRTDFWGTLIAGRSDWDRTLVSTVGMIWVTAIVITLYAGGARLAARAGGGQPREIFDTFAPSLIPISLGYAIAHYFSLLMLDGGQEFLIRLSDPLDRGWDLIGTGDWQVNFLFVSAATIAWVQAIGIVAGHIGGVLGSHDRALEIHERQVAVRSQYPMVAVMIIYTVGALVLLLGA